MVQGVTRTHPSLLSGRVGYRLGAVERQETADVSTATAAVTNYKETLSAAPVAQTNAGNNAGSINILKSECHSGVYPSFLSEATPSPELSVERTPCGGWHRCQSSL